MPTTPAWFQAIRKRHRKRLIAPREWADALFRRKNSWSSPFRIVDDDGLYIGAGGGVLYRELPTAALRDSGDGTDLERLLHQLAQQLGDREVHMAAHTWEEQVQLPDGTPRELAEYLTESHTFYVPSRRILIGVALSQQSDATSQGIASDFNAAADALLGEKFPDLSSWDEDRRVVDDILTTAGAQRLSVEASKHLEAWYTLGAFTDVDVTEQDDVIDVHGEATIELASATDISDVDGPVPYTPIEPGWHGAAVVSVRGRTSAVDSGNESAVGDLRKVSIIVGRRADGRPAPLNVTLRDQAGFTPRPMPLQQLGCLDETLPTSARRMAQTVAKLKRRQLRLVGFGDATRVGDESGLFVGLASPGFAFPAYLNPDGDPEQPVTLVTGAHGSGKTFTSEHLSLQARAAGRAPLYLTRNGAGSPLADDVPALEPGAGALNPFRWLTGARAFSVAYQALECVVPHLTPDEKDGLAAGFRRAEAVGAATFTDVFTYADSASAVARCKKAAAAGGPAAAVLDDGLVASVPMVPALVNLPHLTASTESLADLACALLLEHGWATGRLFTVLDDVLDLADATITAGALAGHPAPGHVIVVATSPPEIGNHVTPFAAAHIAHAEPEANAAARALAVLGTTSSEEKVAWLAEAAPVFDEVLGGVGRPALALYRHRDTAPTALLVGPVPRSQLPTLTRGRAERYTNWE